MSAAVLPPPAIVFREGGRSWLAFAVGAALLFLVFGSGLADMVETWGERAEYSYGYVIPPLVAFLVWQRKDVLERIPATGSWLGLPLVLAGLLLNVIGDLGVSYLMVKWGFLFALWGLALAYLGPSAFRVILVPLLLLVTMLPLPEFLLQGLSQRLQLLSSSLGVALIRACDISVNLEGNVIDLGPMQLQVAEACNGLRYLFPLIALGIVAAYFFKGALWKRVVIVLSTLPITVLMNSLRIGLIGVTVEHWGIEMAEGVLHDFEGLVVFLGCTALLVAQMWLLARIGPSPLPLRSAFGLDFPAPTPKSALVRYRSLPASFVAALGLLAGAALVAAVLPARNPERPERHELLQFPMSIDAWRGQPERIDRAALDVLNADDTLLANYRDARGNLVNLYVAYFAAQSRAAEAHSPRICIPGGGWDIESLRPVTLDGVPFGDAALRVNRVVISRGEQRQLVYYWFQQRGRNITHEYAAKWFILVDQIRINRSDGAMVRLTTPIRRGEDEAQAEARLNAFAAELVPLLAAYIPGAPDEPGRASVARR